MKLNDWVKNIKRLRIDRPTVKEFKRLDFAERTINFDKKFFKTFINSIKQEDLITYPSYKDYLDIRKLIAKNNKSKLENVYYALTFGDDLVRIYTLNSEISVAGDQAKWLQNDLETNSSKNSWNFAQYHTPIRPHQSGKSENNDQYAAWAGLFYKHGVKLVFESDSHMVKTTKALNFLEQIFLEKTNLFKIIIEIQTILT